MQEVPSLLLAWYHQNRRILPWREEVSPYRVWISEIMLQQTRVRAVIPYYERFLKTLPTVSDLAQADDDLLKKLWEGLGYYSRVRHLKAAAIKVMEEFGGELPADYKLLQTLPGIGEYTAGAIGSIAFGLKVPVVDGNVFRVLARVFASHIDITKPQAKTVFTKLAALMLPDTPGDYNQALMELGATVCVPNGAPLCEACPIKNLCASYNTELAELLPIKSEKPPRTVQEYTVLIYCHDGKVFLQKRPEKGLLAGMWGFVMQEGIAEPQHFEFPVVPLGKSKHIFTHIEWHMVGYMVFSKEASADGIWVTPDELSGKYAIPAAYRKYRDAIGENIG
ncbi:MAG: A/G-specific adenine glycosylase [Ruminococcaceae bacterium]|nr:A/G-specific adenine glycosylase [Oscillospiraceae bacterium]